MTLFRGPMKDLSYGQERKVQYPEIWFLPVLCHEQKQDILRKMEGRATFSVYLYSCGQRDGMGKLEY